MEAWTEELGIACTYIVTHVMVSWNLNWLDLLLLGGWLRVYNSLFFGKGGGWRANFRASGLRVKGFREDRGLFWSMLILLIFLKDLWKIGP